MNSFPKRLLALAGGILFAGLLATGFSLLVTYKPWGVHDLLREEYDTRVAAINHRNQLINEFENKERPVLAVREIQQVGLVEPNAAAEHLFEIRNEGKLPLTLEFRDTTPSVRAELSEETIGPGEISMAKIAWTTLDDAGDFELQATLATNDPLQAEVLVKLKGTVKSMLVVPESISFEQADLTEQAGAEFIAYSQVSEDLEIVDVQSDREHFDWNAEPISISDETLQARSAWIVRVWTTGMKYGKYSGTIKVKAKPHPNAQEDLAQELAFKGKVRSPVNFYSPDIHRSDGLDIGTLQSGKEHNFHLVVRLRGDLDREIEVLDVKPDELEASLEPLSAQGNHRLTLTVPADCPSVVFNIDEKHGYVEVGDPKNKHFSNWFPIYGAVVNSDP